MGLLSGLAHFGLGNLENMELYEEPDKAENETKEKEEVKTVREEELLFDKSYTCPVCSQKFKARTVKTGRARLLGSDQDLRPRYEHIEMLKYDVIMCPSCGYTALSRFFGFVTAQQAKNIKSAISEHFIRQTELKDIYTFDEALERYQMALANAVVKKTKASEKAYICLKTAWLLRSKAEHLEKDLPDYEAEKKQCADKENEFLHNAMEGFMTARRSESFPMCGLDQATVDYLIAVTAVRFEQYDVAGHLVMGILQTSTNQRMKERARELKKIVLEKMQEKNISS